MTLEQYVKGALAGVVLGIAGFMGGSLECIADETIVEKNSSAKAVRQKADTLWKQGRKNDAINLYMRLPTVNDVLGNCVEYVKYDREKGKTNFDKLVYQRHIKKGDRKPVLVLFYMNVDPKKINTENVSQRLGTIFRKLSQQYSSEIKFVVYEANTHPALKKKHYLGLFNKYNFTGIPSIQMYSPWNAKKRQTKEKNEGLVKHIDTLKGGPEKNYLIFPWWEAQCFWVNNNITAVNLKKKLYRYNDGYILKSVN